MLAENDVIYAFKMLLNRMPEEEAIKSLCASQLKTIEELGKVILTSEEFRIKNSIITNDNAVRVPFNAKPMQVEVHTDPVRMAKLLQMVTAQWQYLGTTEPHWSVLTSEKFRKDFIDETKNSFYETGNHEVDDFISASARVGVHLSSYKTCIELGCGVGRVTQALAKKFKTTGVDISKSHLDEAGLYFSEVGVDGVQLVHMESLDLFSKIGKFDVAYSKIVLQHNPPPVMYELLRGLLSVINLGGVAYFQIPTYCISYNFSVDHYMKKDNLHEMEMHFMPQNLLFKLIESSGCIVLDIREDDAIGMLGTAISNTMIVQKIK